MTERIIIPLISVLGQWAKISLVIPINRLKFLSILAFENREKPCVHMNVTLALSCLYEWWHDWSLLHPSAKSWFGNGTSKRLRPGGTAWLQQSEDDTAGHSLYSSKRLVLPQLQMWLLHPKPDQGLHKQFSQADFFILYHFDKIQA